MPTTKPAKIGKHLTVILGPPGTGKTTRLLNLIDGLLVEGVPSTAIAFVSFTKAACSEAVGRVVKRFGMKEDELPWFRTLHSTCVRLRTGRHAVMKRGEWTAFAKRFRLQLSDIDATEDEFGALPQQTEDDKIRAAIAWGRHRCLDLNETLRAVKLDMPARRAREFHAALQQFKAESHCIDFEDMLEYAKTQEARPGVSVVFIDESQDLSPLLASVADHLFGETERVFVAGDDDQAIFEFQGADPSWLMAMREAADEQEILDQSYRIPARVHEMAQRIIARNMLRVPKEYRPRQEQGRIHRAATFRRAVELTSSANGGRAPESVFVLARNWAAVDRCRSHLEDLGIPFGVKRKHNAPLEKPIWVKAINCACDLRDGIEVVPSALAALAGNIPAKLPGGKALIPWGFKTGADGLSSLPKDVPVSREDLIGRWEGLRPLFDLLDKEGPLGLFIKPAKTTPDQYPVLRAYFGRLLSKFERLPTPTWWLSTIHSVKGSEADVVILLSDLSRKSSEAHLMGTQAEREAEQRVAYVGVTRARNGVILVDPKDSLWTFPYWQYARGLIEQSEEAVVEEQKPNRVEIQEREEPKIPYLTPAGVLVIPFESELKYRWWAGGQSIIETLFEIGAPASVVARYNQETGR